MVAATKGDDGCESYGFFADLNDSDRRVNVEVWRDQHALDEHMSHEHTREFLTSMADLVDGEPEMTIHEVLAPAASAKEGE